MPIKVFWLLAIKLILAKFAQKGPALEGHWGLAQRIKRGLNMQALEGWVPGSSKETHSGNYNVPLWALVPVASTTTICGWQYHSQDGRAQDTCPSLCSEDTRKTRPTAVENLISLLHASVFVWSKDKSLNLTPKQMQAFHPNSLLSTWTHLTQPKTPEGHINLTHKISPKFPTPKPQYTALIHNGSLNKARKTWVLTTGQALFWAVHILSHVILIAILSGW